MYQNSDSSRKAKTRNRRTWQHYLLLHETTQKVNRSTIRNQYDSSRTKYIKSALPLDEPLRGGLRLTRVRQVDREPDEFTLALSHPFLFHPPDRVFRLFLAPRGEVHLRTASY